MIAPVRAIHMLVDAEERERRRAIERIFRETELTGMGLYDAADAMRQVADHVASGFVHRPPERGLYAEEQLAKQSSAPTRARERG